jgi:hypothetical protein
MVKTVDYDVCRMRRGLMGNEHEAIKAELRAERSEVVGGYIEVDAIVPRFSNTSSLSEILNSDFKPSYIRHTYWKHPFLLVDLVGNHDLP